MGEGLATLHDDLQDLLGQTIAGRYRVGALVGVGGMAAVFRVEHLGLGREMAIKVLHPQLTSLAEVSARFDREARSASRLDHPNCVQVTDYGSTEQGMKFMIMQLLEGKELSHVMRSGRLEPLRALEITVQILRGLEHAHKVGVIHRDIKPENVFVTRDHDDREVLKLVDFGIAKIIDGTIDDKHKTLAGMVFGTPAYMSPEQAMGVDADARSDLYSTGVLLYQMLSGELPFDSEDPVALVRMQVSMDPDPLPASVPPLLAATVARLLQKDRDKRFQTATEALQVLDALRAMLGGGEVDAALQAANTSGPIIVDSSRCVVVDPTGSILVDGSGQMSVVDPSQSMRVGGVPRWDGLRTQTDRLTQAMRARPRWQVYFLSGMVTVMGLALLAWLGRHEIADSGLLAGVPGLDLHDDSAATGEAAGEKRPGAVSAAPVAEALKEVDQLLLAKKVDDADALLSPLRDAYPEDAQLAWRKGKVFALRKKDAQALGAYGDALQLDPALMDDKVFYAELHDLMRKPKVRADALDLALQHMGTHAHPFLLEQVNDERRPLGYSDRKRAIVELSNDEANAKLVNERLNMALDVLQAVDAATPCAAYRSALDAIAAEPDHYFFARVEKAKVPETPGAAGGETPEACDGLAQRRAEVLELLAPLGSEAGAKAGKQEEAEEETIEVAEEEEPKQAAKPRKAKRTRKSSRKSRVDCNKPGALFKRECWKKNR